MFLLVGWINIGWFAGYRPQVKVRARGICRVCLIELCVVNSLCIGEEKSICFLTAVTSRPWGERLKLADTHTHSHISKALPTKPSNHTSRAQTSTCTATASSYWNPQCKMQKNTPSFEDEDVHERLLSQGKVRAIYRSAACWEKSQERETYTGQKAKRQWGWKTEERKRVKPAELTASSSPFTPIYSEFRTIAQLWRRY